MSNTPAAHPLASALPEGRPLGDQRVHRATMLRLVELPAAQVRHAQATPGQPSATQAIAGTMRESGICVSTKPPVCCDRWRGKPMI